MDKISPIKNKILQYLDYMGIAKTEFCEQGEEIERLKRENEELKRQGGSGALGAG